MVDDKISYICSRFFILSFHALIHTCRIWWKYSDLKGNVNIYQVSVVKNGQSSVTIETVGKIISNYRNTDDFAIT